MDNQKIELIVFLANLVNKNKRSDETRAKERGSDDEDGEIRRDDQ